MLKGVNRQVIEISETGSRYFERAILIVRPEFFGEQAELLHSDARRVVTAYGRPPAYGGVGETAAVRAARNAPGRRKWRPGVKRVLLWGTVAAVVLVVGALALRFI